MLLLLGIKGYQLSSAHLMGRFMLKTTSIQKDDAKPETIPERIDGSSSALSSIDAYLIDLDGTIYSPSGPIEGAAEFYAAVLRHKPHVFLSNTGAKGADGVRSKLARNGIIMGPRSQSLHIHTAPWT